MKHPQRREPLIYSEDPDEILDLRVTEYTIREYEENGYIKCGEALYRVVRENDDNHCVMSDQEWTKMFHPNEEE